MQKGRHCCVGVQRLNGLYDQAFETFSRLILQGLKHLA
jgi:hypothetical protein